MKKKNILIIVILLIILLGAIVSYQFFNNKTESKDSLNESIKIGTNIGDMAPDFTLKKVNGEEVTLSKLRGKKVIINFWTTDCVFCRLEMPELQKLHEEYPDIEILAVNIMEDRGKVINYLLTNGYTFPALLDSNGRVAIEYLVRGTPTSYFIDEKGIIINRKVGASNYQQLLTVLGIE